MQKFKPGDWARQVKENYSKFERIYRIKYILDDGTVADVEDNIFDVEVIGISHGAFELWQPKEGEWCWFQWAQPKTVNYQILSKFKLSSPCGRYHEDINGMCFDFCEPFIGELPSSLKNKR